MKLFVTLFCVVSLTFFNLDAAEMPDIQLKVFQDFASEFPKEMWEFTTVFEDDLLNNKRGDRKIAHKGIREQAVVILKALDRKEIYEPLLEIAGLFGALFEHIDQSFSRDGILVNALVRGVEQFYVTFSQESKKIFSNIPEVYFALRGTFKKTAQRSTGLAAQSKIELEAISRKIGAKIQALKGKNLYEKALKGTSTNLYMQIIALVEFVTDSIWAEYKILHPLLYAEKSALGALSNIPNMIRKTRSAFIDLRTSIDPVLFNSLLAALEAMNMKMDQDIHGGRF